MSELSTYEKRIRRLAPEVVVNSISINREGLLNDVVIVNGELIFRFPKHEYGFKHLKDEARILRLLQNHITLDIPFPLYESDDCLAYRMIPGETLRRDLLMRLPEDEQQAVADQLAQFLRELHSVRQLVESEQKKVSYDENCDFSPDDNYCDVQRERAGTRGHQHQQPDNFAACA